MRFFTRAVVSGDLNDAEVERISACYQQHIGDIAGSASPEIAELAQTNLHDGLIRRVVVQPDADELVLSLRCGDLQVGYFDIDILYLGVSIDAQQLEVLTRRVHDRRTEILAGEIDRLPDGRFVHRLIFWPDDELEMVFSSLNITRQAQQDRIMACDVEPYIEFR